jgi:class 3 adenylate cyclase/predicted negative regulator of RcsB-dependent stress response
MAAGQNRGVISRVLSPVLVGRQHELSELEDALLSANRGDGRLVLLAGEAGIGKTRLSRELARRAQKLGCDVLWGSCSEAELSLPYLPFVEAIGTQLDEQDLDALRAELGPMVAELAQVFPQLGEGQAPPETGDQAQARLRLFESFVALLDLWAGTNTLLVVLDDVHWADSSTRELLEYAARRLSKSRVMLLATYRSDELDRLHPLTRAVQTWRRGGLADTVAVEAMTEAQVAEMIAAILSVEDVGPELASFVHERTEGNPFVLEEMLREAIDRGEVFQSDTGWDRRSLDAFQLPETVRETVLLRLGRLDDEHVDVLRAGAVLGRSFDYRLLVEVAESDEQTVLAALEQAVAQQLLDEEARAGDRYTWRHALTQEAIAGDTVLPKRLRAHSRAADALLASGGSPLQVARHLIAAGRAAEALDACLQAAEEAERASGFDEANGLLERVLPHVPDPRDRALLLYRMGRLRWLDGEPAAGEQLLSDAVRRLDELGLATEAAEARIHLGRCYWELERPDEAMEAVEQAREALEREGPSAQLALAYIRIAGFHAFRLDYDLCRVAAERGAEIAEQASADFERVWALSFVALGWFGTAREFELFSRIYEESIEKGYSIIAGNTIHNEIWDRVHTLAGETRGAAERYDRVSFLARTIGVEISKSWADLASGEPRKALAQARLAIARHESLGNPKFEWRSRLAAVEALLELGRSSEAAEELPPPSPGKDLQDIVYDTPAQVGVAVALGRREEAAELGRRAAGNDELLRVSGTVTYAVEGLLAGGLLDEARAVLSRARRARAEFGQAGLELSEGRILLESGKPAEARPLFEQALVSFEQSELPIWAWRAAALAADAAAQSGDKDAARSLIASCIRDAHRAGAIRARDAALAVAERFGLDVPPLEDEPDAEVGMPGVLTAGERLVTSMFADVRGYTPIAAASAPEDLADRMTTLHRWAAAEVGKRQGIVDKFAGDAVMATFNVTGARVDHAALALDAALALRDKAALMDLPVGIGIAVGPAVVSRSVDERNVSVLGSTTNLAARLQTAAGGGDILLSDEAYRRVSSWLSERGLTAEPEELELKGFDGTQPAYRLPSPVRA